MTSKCLALKSSRAFTIIELLIVIAIIGILASVVLGSLHSSETKARIATTKAQLHEFQIAFELFNTEFNDYPPTPGGTDFCNMCAYWPPSARWAHGDWQIDVIDQLAAAKTPAPAANDPWGNPYLYDKNYDISRYGQGGCDSWSPICSMGPDGVLQTPNCQDPSQPPQTFGDDICIFLQKAS